MTEVEGRPIEKLRGITAREALAAYMEANGYNALYDGDECGCLIDDLGACDYFTDGWRMRWECILGCYLAHANYCHDCAKVGTCEDCPDPDEWVVRRERCFVPKEAGNV